MKISFDTPLTYTDGTPIAAADLAAASYTLYLDTVTPPAKSYPVPAANVAAAATNPDGSKHVTVDAVKDLGLNLTPGATYYVDVTDTVTQATSDPSAVLTYVYSPKPEPPRNFTTA